MSSRRSTLRFIPLVLAILLSSVCSLAAQERGVPPLPPGAPGRITGVVTGPDGQPLNSAAITIRSAANAAVVTGTMTGRDGRFRIDGLAFGKYRLHASFIGHTGSDREFTLAPAQPAFDAGTLRLEVAPVALEAVQAEAQRSPIVLQADRTVYNTKDMPAASGGSAADVLRHIDELEVDFNGKVSMTGNRPVAIHLNGRPAPMQGEQLERFLTQMSGKMVAKVEVMPNPSAQHDPEGMGGIVNIVLKENVDLGLSGSFGLNMDTRGNRGLNTRLAYQKGRFTFFGGGSGNMGDNESTNHDLRKNLISTPVTFFEQQGTSDNESYFGFGDFSTEFKLAERTILWGNGYGARNGWDALGSTQYDIYDEQRNFIDRYARRTDNDSDYSFYDVGFGIKHQFIPQRHELTVDLRRNDNDMASVVDAIKEYQLDGGDIQELTANNSDNASGATTLKADYIRPWRERGNVSAGLSIARRTTDEESLSEVFARISDQDPASTLAAAFLYEEWIRAIYVNAAQTFGKFNLQAGVRGEFAATEFSLGASTQQFDNDYNSVFPNVSASYEVAKGRTVRLGYSKRVGRPPTFYLNPYRPTTDPLNRFEGNPNLKPNYTHSVSADFSWIGTHGTLRISPYFNKTVDNWDQIKTVDENGVAVTRVENTAQIRRIGSSFTLGMRPQGRLGGSIGFSLFHVRNDATNISSDYSRESFRWSTNTNLTAKLTSTLNATLNAHYQPPRDLPQGRQTSWMFSSVGLRQQLFKQKATLNVYVNDPLDMARFEVQTRDRTHEQLSKTVPRNRSASVSLSYNFGKPPQQHSRRDQADTGSIQQ